MKLRSAILFLAVSLLVVPATAGNINEWGARFSVGTEMKLAKGLDLSAGLQYSLNNDFRSTDKTKFALDLSYRLFRNKSKKFNLKTSLGYEYSKERMPEKTEIKNKDIVLDFNDNEYQEYNVTLTDAWWSPSHRVKFSLSGKLELGRFTLSLREMYRYIHTDRVDVNQAKSKFRYDEGLGTIALKDSVSYSVDSKGGDNDHILRSKFEISYNIPHFKANPFIMAEVFNNVASGFRLERMRYRAGFDMTFKKHNCLSIYYQFQNYVDQKFLHTPGIEYTYKF